MKVESLSEVFIRNNSEEEVIDPNKCEMLGTLGYVIQIGLGLLAFTILFLKRCCEKPKRPWKVWCLDASKQIFSAGLAHILNLVLSVFLSSEEGDACTLYFINTLMDCTVGVLITFGIMKLLDCLSKAKGWKFIQSGLYYDIIEEGPKRVVKLKLKMYFTQLIIWLIVTCIAKGILVAIQHLLGSLLLNFGHIVLKPFNSNGTLKLVMVMIIIPLVLDAFYFWVVDNILKLNPNDADKEIQTMYLGLEEEETSKNVEDGHNATKNNNIGAIEASSMES